MRMALGTNVATKSGLNKYIVDRFGSRWGLLNYSKYSLQQLRGVYRPYVNVQWPRVQRLVFICMGNICRSALACGYAKHLGANTESFGIDCRDDLPADPRAIEYAAGAGFDLSMHRTRNLRQYSAQHGDLLVVMEPAHLPAVKGFADVAQITLAGLWLPLPNPYVHDPYSSTPAYFRHCEDKMVAVVKRMLQLRGL
jgi:protein-tyrosine phosphatase